VDSLRQIGTSETSHGIGLARRYVPEAVLLRFLLLGVKSEGQWRHRDLTFTTPPITAVQLGHVTPATVWWQSGQPNWSPFGRIVAFPQLLQSGKAAMKWHRGQVAARVHP